MARIHHVGATVDDLERSRKFYVEALGCRTLHPIEPGPDPRLRELVGVPDAVLEGLMLETGGGDQIELLSYATSYGRRLDLRPCDTPTLHLAFAVDDLAVATGRAVELGGSVIGGPVDLGGTRIAYCHDPDGNVVELLEET
jgi:catechol 2,3-dioxygenase-like lactoylglutathione lyase family enzyme